MGGPTCAFSWRELAGRVDLAFEAIKKGAASWSGMRRRIFDLGVETMCGDASGLRTIGRVSCR